jgi:hypothetical protein
MAEVTEQPSALAVRPLPLPEIAVASAWQVERWARICDRRAEDSHPFCRQGWWQGGVDTISPPTGRRRSDRGQPVGGDQRRPGLRRPRGWLAVSAMGGRCFAYARCRSGLACGGNEDSPQRGSVAAQRARYDESPRCGARPNARARRVESSRVVYGRPGDGRGVGV